MSEEKSELHQHEIPCSNCGAKLTFAPGHQQLKCEFCGTLNEIIIDKNQRIESTREIDYLDFLNTKAAESVTEEIKSIKCTTCGATTTLQPNVVSDFCAFCNSPLIASQALSTKQIKPSALLPFKVSLNEGNEQFKKWLNSLWWAPNDLKRLARQQSKLAGMYLPYWTYDSDTETDYSGERGDNYYVQETYTNDKGQTQTRTVTKVRWHSVSGHVSNTFDDVLVVASSGLPTSYVDKLDPWDLNNLVPYDPKFLSGFRSESYQIPLTDGFEIAKEKMDGPIRQTINRDIGGDHQRIHNMDVEYNNITFKHILLPIWLSAYRYNSKVYRFVINARTGEVQGERPYSWIKITLAVLLVAAIIFALYYYFEVYQYQ